MHNPVRWLAAAIFWLAGVLTIALPSLVRAMLYAGLFAQASWNFPNRTVEKLVPTHLLYFGLGSMALGAVALLWPEAPPPKPHQLKGKDEDDDWPLRSNSPP